MFVRTLGGAGAPFTGAASSVWLEHQLDTLGVTSSTLVPPKVLFGEAESLLKERAAGRGTRV